MICGVEGWYVVSISAFPILPKQHPVGSASLSALDTSSGTAETPRNYGPSAR
jgi:hypothetical protein